VAKKAKLGTFLVDGKGRSLYLFEKDTTNKSTCYGSCASVWPPLTTAGKPHAPSGISASHLGTITRKNGKSQVTYYGHPLYYYVGDHSPGQVKGQGLKQFGALWYVVSPQGKAVTSGASSSGGSGGGY
jgi:predicted lipoprotein with Yx(FWY)xxD motif